MKNLYPWNINPFWSILDPYKTPHFPSKSYGAFANNKKNPHDFSRTTIKNIDYNSIWTVKPNQLLEQLWPILIQYFGLANQKLPLCAA